MCGVFMIHNFSVCMQQAEGKGFEKVIKISTRISKNWWGLYGLNYSTCIQHVEGKRSEKVIKILLKFQKM